jgi:Rad3-related DNA helicase
MCVQLAQLSDPMLRSAMQVMARVNRTPGDNAETLILQRTFNMSSTLRVSGGETDPRGVIGETRTELPEIVYERELTT